MADISSDHWKNHFDSRFAIEFEQFSQIIDYEKEYSLDRVINKFARWEEAFELIFNAKKNNFDLTPKDWGSEVSKLPTGLPAYIEMWAMGKSFKVLPYLKFQIGKFLLDFIIHNQLKIDCVVEVGGGWGRNLFDLWIAGLPRDIKLFSAESSIWGQKITKKLSTLEPAVPIIPIDFDIDNPDFGFLSGKKRILFFTHSL